MPASDIDLEKETQGFSNVTHDRTGRKKVEDALRFSDDRYRAVFEDNPTMIVTLNAEWTILSASPSCARQLGYTLDELKGHSVLTLFHRDDQAAVIEHLEGCLKNPIQAHRRQFRKVRKDGATLWAEESAQAVYDLNGAPNLLVVCQDVTERKRMEEALRESEQRFASFMLHLPAAAWIKNLNGRYVYVNAEAEHVMSMSMSAMQGKTDEEVFPPEYARPFHANDQRVLAEGGSLRTIEVLRQDDGIEHHSIVSKFTVPGLDGQPAYIAGVALDITEKQKAEDALRESETRFHAIFDLAAVGIAQVGLNGQWLMMNQKLADTLGYSFDELGKMTLQQISHPDDIEPHLARVRSLLADEVPAYAMEKRYIRKNGSILWVNLNVTLVRDQHGEPMYFIAIMEDINERKKNQDALRESEERFRHLADTAPVLIWMSGTDALSTFFSKPWLEFTGRTLEQEQGNGWAEGVHPEDLGCCQETYISAFNTRRDFRMEYRLRRADGEYRWMVDTGIPRFMPNGDFAGYIGSCIDITERKYAEEEVKRLNMSLKERTAELEDANKELEAFNYTVAHDLRQPLNVISMNCQAIKELCGDMIDEVCLGFLQNSVVGTMRMNSLIDALLNFSRMGRVESCREMVDLSFLAQEVVTMLRQAEPERQADFRIADGIVANGDTSQLRMVLENLLGNAWKYTGKKKEAVIEFDLAEIDGEPTYFVRDNGAGFDCACAAKLFVPFQRLPGAEEFKGFGIGLATVERIIRRHGGKVWAEGEPDKGACIYFTLSAEKEDLHR